MRIRDQFTPQIPRPDYDDDGGCAAAASSWDEDAALLSIHYIVGHLPLHYNLEGKDV